MIFMDINTVCTNNQKMGNLRLTRDENHRGGDLKVTTKRPGKVVSYIGL